jgi:hypothetical protein
VTRSYDDSEIEILIRSFTFNDNVQGTVDLQSWLEGPIFEPLKDRSCFERFFIDGGTVVWPNGADIAPETLYEAVKLAGDAHHALEPTAPTHAERAAHRWNHRPFELIPVTARMEAGYQLSVGPRRVRIFDSRLASAIAESARLLAAPDRDRAPISEFRSVCHGTIFASVTML